MKSRSSVIGVIRSAMMIVSVTILASGTVFAKDSVKVNVTNATGNPVIVNNGQATGTIQLFYTVSAMEFTPGYFATFDIDWQTIAPAKNATNYGSGVNFNLLQSQQGGNVDLTPSPDSFLLTHAGQTGTSTVTISIVNDKNGNPPSNLDGTDLVGNLKLDAGQAVGTVTNIQVHIILAHPTSCFRVYNFVTDADFQGILDTVSLNVGNGGPNAGKVVSSQPGQLSDNVLVVNACGASHAFDLRVVLDSNFSTNPVNNPGNAVFTYSAAGAFSPSTSGQMLSGTGTGQQQNLCLQNVTVASGSSFLMTVKSQVKNVDAATLPASDNFDFSAMLYQEVNQGCSGLLDALASPNPATFALPFTIK